MVKKYGELYLNARKALRPSQGDNASVYARELLSLASGKSVAALLADRELYASEEIEEKLNGFLARILAGEPLAYILGEWSFYGLPFLVTPDVLIPRDDTMAVTDLAIEAARTYPAPQRVLDLCTGSGCIGLALAHCVETARVTLAGYLRAGASRGKAECGKSAAQKPCDGVLCGRFAAGAQIFGAVRSDRVQSAVRNHAGDGKARRVRLGIRAASGA